ncbi:MAG: winged helix-turn-helix domain-containing protein [Caldimonas sp.]
MREYRFHEFALQVESRRLLGAGGQVVELTPRLFDALLHLVERPGELLEKDRLLTELWPGLVVEENNLSQSVSALRRALGDDAQRSRFIQTVPRRGFRFVAPVAVVDTSDERAAASAAKPEEPPPGAVVPETVAIAAATPLPRPASRRTFAVALGAGALAATAAGVSAWRWWPARRPASPGRSSTLAVLPFKPIVAGTGDELLQIGMAESLVARLSNLPGVAVRSVGSVRRYRGIEQDPIAAAQELDVTWVVDGSIQRVGSRVRITARLLNTASGEAAWSGSFDERYDDMFDLQDSISTKVAQVLAPHLERGDRLRLAGAGGTRQLDAYQLYLAARQNAQGIKAAGLLKSIDLYRQAIDLDPSYAQAWSGLGESYRRMVFGADGEPRIVLAEAKRANERAVELDPELAEGHAGLGWNRFWYDWDWGGAAASFDTALGLNASEANAHFGYAQLLEALGRNEEALEHLRRARESDPMSLILLTLESSSLIGAGRIAEARQRLQRVFDIDRDFWVARMLESYLLIADGKTEAGIETMALADQLSDGSSQAAAALGNLLARKGQTERARAVLQRLVDLSRSRYVPPTSIGLIHAGLGDREAALTALEQAFAVRDVRMTLVKYDGRWKPVSDDRRFAALMQRMKLA